MTALAGQAKDYGISYDVPKIEFVKTSAKMEDTVGKLRNNLEELLKSKGIDIIYGKGELIGTHDIKCGDSTIHAKYIILATGSKPSNPLTQEAVCSDEALALDHIPQRVKIIGGGVVAVEFANIWNQLGADVTIQIRGERILRNWDKELAVGVTQNLKKNGIQIEKKCTLEDFTRGQFDFVLSANGRIPDLEGIDAGDVHLDERGFVIVNDCGRTNIDNIYAAGDVVSNSTMLAHVAMEQGRRAVQAIAGKEIDKKLVVAQCIYVDPEVASVGMTEKTAKETGHSVLVGKQNMVSNARTVICTNARSFIKVVADRTTHKILGAQLMCENASDIAAEFVVAINNELTIEDIKESVHPHPSYAEAIMDVMDVLLEKVNEV
jgi:dihydrolipoamide dehydrogenase